MKQLLIAAGAATLLAGCQVTPNTNDTTNATLRFRIHYQQPDMFSPYVEITTNQSTEAGRCLFVAEPFGVTSNAADSGGIRWMDIGESAFFHSLVIRQTPGDITAIPSPTVTTQQVGSDTIPNPGASAGSALLTVNYASGKAFDTVTLHATYQFAAGASTGALQGTVHNFGANSGGGAQVHNFFVRRASAKSNEQPGMSCKI